MNTKTAFIYSSGGLMETYETIGRGIPSHLKYQGRIHLRFGLVNSFSD